MKKCSKNPTKSKTVARENQFQFAHRLNKSHQMLETIQKV